MKTAVFLKSSLLFNSFYAFSVCKQAFSVCKRVNNLKNRTAMKAKTSVFVICVKTIIYLLIYNSHDCSCKVLSITKSSCPGVFLENVIRKMCSKFTGEHPCQRIISIKLLCNFIEIHLLYGCSRL